MAFTTEQQKKIDYLRSSLRLQAPDIETDPAYIFTDDDLYAIMEVVAPVHNPSYTVDTMPMSETYFVMLLAKKEVYYRLATTTAPFYPLSAEGAKLEKNVRFDHYLALIKEVNKEYENFQKNAGSGDEGDLVNGTIQTYQTTLWGKPYMKRYEELAEAPYIELELSEITETTVNLDWSRYDSPRGNDFKRYLVYYGENPVYDEYALKPLGDINVPDYIINDVRRTKLRLENLKENTTYYVLVRVESTMGLSGYVQQKFSTKNSVVSP